MVQTLFLKFILEKAEEVMNEFGDEYLTASHIVVAVADFCKTRYNGLDSEYFFYPKFEEERLRYIFQQEIKLAGYFRLALSISTKNNVKENEFDFEACKRVALARGADILSSDVVFVCAMTQLGEKHKRSLRTISNEESVYALLEETDKNVFDFAIDKLETVIDLLKKKAEEAARIRDWKPAEKFIEPEEMLNRLFNNITSKYENNVLHILVPEFLRETDLELSVYKVNDSYIVHDNGCAVKCLSKRIDDTKIKNVLDLLWGKSNINDNKIFAKFTDVKDILYFIQEVILTSNADSYYEYFKEELFGCRRYIEPCDIFENEQQAKDFDVKTFINALKDTVTTDYDENKGISLRFDSRYCNCSYGIKVLIETLNDGTIRFSDAYKNTKYETGEMLEAFYCGSSDNEDALYYDLMQKLASPFGMEFDMTSSIIFPEYRGAQHSHKNPYMLTNVNNWISDFYKFMNAAVLISVVADRIKCKKIREW